MVCRDIGRDLIPDFDEIVNTVVTILRRTRPIWNCVKMVIMDSDFCVTKGLVELRKKGVFGSALIKKRIYCPENIKGDAIYAPLFLKEVGNVDTVKKKVDRLAYHVFFYERSILRNEAHDYIRNIGANR